MPRPVLFALALLLGIGSVAPAAEPLHQRIDKLLAAKSGAQTARPQASDAEFVRRAYLDLAGRIPSATETRAFLADKAPDKRTQLVDRLLASPEYPRRMQELFNVILMERRGENAAWDDYLKASFEANKPWDQLVREIIRPDANSEATRAAAWFATRRLEKVGQQDTDYPGLTRDVGRLFLGIDLQCAQCHNHLFIDEYKQVDFQGLYSVFGNTFIRTDTKFPALGEKLLTKKLEFVSVFDPTKRETGPRVPFGSEIPIPPPPEKAEDKDKKAKKEKPDPNAPPSFSALEALAEKLPTAENTLFAKNIVNRLWFTMLGRGLVHPLDLHHGKNPPSHPEVLELLSQEFAAGKFDVKGLIRELALTQAYQRTSVLSDPAPAKESYLAANEKRMSAEQLLWSVLEAAGERERFLNPSDMPKATAEKPPGEKSTEAKPADKPVTLKDLRAKFVKAFANPAKEPETDFNASVQGALFLLNDEQIRRLFEPRSGNLVDRLVKLPDDAAVAEELYVSVLTRLPTAEEQADVAEFLSKRADRRAVALGQIAWALTASMEFCVNH